MSGWQPYEIIRHKPDAAGANILIIADHASNHVPDGIELGITPEDLAKHIAIDIGVADVTRALCASLGCGAMLAGVSRLVIDFNREEDAQGLIPTVSDGVAIPGNVGADAEARLAAFYRPYHAAVARAVDTLARPFILSLHSFTPSLATMPEQHRPWDIGILYNTDDRAARIAIPMLIDAGLGVGDQLPYAGTALNATMNLHAEAPGIPYLGVEMRQDHIGSGAGVARMAAVLAPVLLACSNRLA
ncbi:N-formylglutamate amidohydrolase [Blastomonas sp.]|uniref:N-formylglutamate amidohydrolase n=1 Tax=Blastomonas sp. TaxID=1909299 RepID=UPI002617A0B8|nr:N-formylglutamate amidohydrolase [Blastomonas sp.]MDM7956286.1 N-formylglutamate amidohydrolase [Blastomonas sp.]